MNIRTISQLPRLSETEQIKNNSLFNISQYTDSGKYRSVGLSFSQLSSQLTQNIDSDMSVKYGMDVGGIGYNLSQRIDSLSSGNVTITGNKTFQGEIKLTNTKNLSILEPDSDDYAATKGYVNKKIVKELNYFSDSMTLEDDKYVDPVSNKKECSYSWNMNTDKSSGEYCYKSDEQLMNSTGQLIMYGWVQAPSSIKTEDAWVALEAYINEKWIMIQMQPWVVGSKSSFFQYVSFNVPVKSGLKLRVITGFEPKTTSSGYGSGGLLIMEGAAISMNRFVGYILKGG